MYISKELALILKDKGFDFKDCYWYVDNATNSLFITNYTPEDEGYKEGEYTLLPTEHQVVDWVFENANKYIDEPIVNPRENVIERDWCIKWLQFWYITLLEHKFSLMHEFIGRLEEWFENNNYYLFPEHEFGKGWFYNIENITGETIAYGYDIHNKYIKLKQQAKHETIMKIFKLLKP